jgi:anthranilate phosphoribosyltransferase
MGENEQGFMSDAFRELLRKVGSGPHTGKHLTRHEAAEAMRMMLLGEATPAQIGAFMIAHRILRPTGEELAGMLDAYDALGATLTMPDDARGTSILILGSPYDGRSRTAPISPLTALILASAQVPVVMHGGDRMPTKQGIPFIEIWQGLGVEWRSLSVQQVQQVFEQTHLAFLYLPQHHPQAQHLVTYRDQIGKRPPIATMELMWSPCPTQSHIVAGYVHRPTESLIQTALQNRQVPRLTTVKGLEGSCDLPRDRTCIIGIHHFGESPSFERLLLHPRDYGFAAEDVPLPSTPELIAMMLDVIHGQSNELAQSAIWNGGFYLFLAGVCSTLEEGFAEATRRLHNGEVAAILDSLRQVVQHTAPPPHLARSRG